jgi:TPR repeat protein
MLPAHFLTDHRMVSLRAAVLLRGAMLAVLVCLPGLSGCASNPPAAAKDVPPRDAVADAMQELRTLAAAGDADAAFRLGLIYDLGKAVPQDFVEAMTWYKLAAARGNATATFNVGVQYDAGRGVAEDHAEAARWYRRAADLGFARADYNLGLMYLHGDGVARDEQQAKRYFEAAERHGAEAARGKLAVLSESEDPAGNFAFAQVEAQILERGLSGLDANAINKLRFAAMKGNPLAQYDLGYCYEHAIGLPTDRVQAFVWYSRSANAAGTKPNAGATRTAAITAVNAVQPQMTVSEQRAAASMLQQSAR